MIDVGFDSIPIDVDAVGTFEIFAVAGVADRPHLQVFSTDT